MWRMRRGSAVVVVAFASPGRRECAASAGRAPVAASLRYQVGDQAIAVAAVDGADELDDPPRVGDGRPLEEECRRVERDAEHLRLLVARHGWLDGLRAGRDADAIALAQQLVK